MADMVDESIGVEEDIDVTDPNITELKYKTAKTEGQRLYNIALCKYKICFLTFSE